MVKTMTPREVEFLNRFMQKMTQVHQNPNQSIGICIEQLAKDKPKDIALYFQDDSWTWQNFNTESNKIANYFLNLGLKHYDTVAIMLENSPEYLFLATGINKIQGITALINIHQKRQALTHALNIVEPKWIVVDGDSLPSLNEIVEILPYKNEQIFVVNNPKNIHHDFIELPNELKYISKTNPNTTHNSVVRETVYYMFTSGTTGLPKAVIMQGFKLYTQGYILGFALAQVDSHDIVYIAMPLYHNVPIGIAWMTAILAGAATALRKRFSASEFWKDIQKYQVTFTTYVGEMPRYLLNQPSSEYEMIQKQKKTLKKMLGLGLRKEIWEQFQSRFQIEHIYEFYGLTEGHRSLYNVEEVPGMIGRNNQGGVELAKVDPETGEFYKNESGFCEKCKPGDIGMALIKIDKKTFFTGYKDIEKTQKKILHNVFKKNDKYFNTSDMLKLHEDLWVSFADRFGDTFRWKGENVSTLEVEAILNSYKAIHMSAVYGVGIPNTEGRAGMAAIKLNPSIKFEIDDFSRFVIVVLPGYSIPKFFRLCDELETTGPEKIKKIDLRKEAYNIEIIKDPLFFWDSKKKQYMTLDNSAYQKIKEGKIRF